MENIQVVNDWLDYNLNNFLLEGNKVIINCNYEEDNINCIDKVDSNTNAIVIYKSLLSTKFESFIYFITKNKSFKVIKLSLSKSKVLNASLYDNGDYDKLLEIKYKVAIFDLIKKLNIQLADLTKFNSVQVNPTPIIKKLQDKLNDIYDECFKVYFKDHKTEVLNDIDNIATLLPVSNNELIERLCDITYDHFVIVKRGKAINFDTEIYRIINRNIEFRCRFSSDTINHTQINKKIQLAIDAISEELTNYFLKFYMEDLTALILIVPTMERDIAIETINKVEENIKEKENSIK